MRQAREESIRKAWPERTWSSSGLVTNNYYGDGGMGATKWEGGGGGGHVKIYPYEKWGGGRRKKS